MSVAYLSAQRRRGASRAINRRAAPAALRGPAVKIGGPRVKIGAIRELMQSCGVRRPSVCMSVCLSVCL